MRFWIESDAVSAAEAAARRGGAKEDKNKDNCDEDADADLSIWTTDDLFADPDPLEVFHVAFDVPIHHHYETEKEEADEADFGHEDNRTTRVTPLHLTLTGYKAELGQTLHSTGLTLWRASSLRLCHFLLQPAHTDVYLRKKTVLELGAGLGLCGILAGQSHFGARHVVLTDGDSETLHYLRQNVQRNHSCSTCCSCSVRQLIWGEESYEQCEPEESTNTTSTTQQQLQLFDTIIGSDLIYHQDMLLPLFQTVQAHLKFNMKHPDDLDNDSLSTSVFVLAFARRNVPLHRVRAAAKHWGLVMTKMIVDAGEKNAEECIDCSNDNDKDIMDDKDGILIFQRQQQR